jgi:very-short-patch-repair endonuclease
MLVQVHRGVYRFSSHVESFEQRCLAALLAAPDAALSGPTAGRIMGLRKVFTDDVHLIARRAIHLESVSAHRTKILGEDDIGTGAGLRVLRPTRLFCDLAWHLDDAGLESVYEQMLDRRMISIDAARAAARRFVASGRPGSVRLARVLDSRPDWLQPADSDLEVQLMRALTAAGLVLRRQCPVVLDSGWTVHLDLADEAIKFGVEVDHVTWHGGRLDAQRDKRRDRELARLGWTISRVSDEDISSRLSETCEQLIAIAHVCSSRTSIDAKPLGDHQWS